MYNFLKRFLFESVAPIPGIILIILLCYVHTLHIERMWLYKTNTNWNNPLTYYTPEHLQLTTRKPFWKKSDNRNISYIVILKANRAQI